MRAVDTRRPCVFELEDHHAGDPLDQATLLRDTLLRTAIAAIPHNDTGSYRGDMLAVLRGWAALFSGEQARRPDDLVVQLVDDVLVPFVAPQSP